MLTRLKRIPRLNDAGLHIRLAQTQTEVEEANRLVYQNYVDQGYWEDDVTFLQKNRYLHSPHRITIVAVKEGKVVGTVSSIRDSQDGLPADSFQPETLKRLRALMESIVEVSALAVDKACSHQRNLIFFLFKYLYQYCFYYAGVDRFVVVCTPAHATFYQSICGLRNIGHSLHYDYVKVDAQLLTVHLLQLHQDFVEIYESGLEYPRNNFYRFLLVDEHPNLQFPGIRQMCRPRDIDWAAQARLARLPLAV